MRAGSWIPGLERAASLSSARRFSFLGEERDLDRHGWDDAAVSKLWRYNLHYFDDLNAAGSPARAVNHRELLARWIRENPAPGGTAWEPYPTSLRIVNWIKWELGGQALSADAAQSLAVQVRWLSRRLEYHLQGNHLFSNGKALVFAGLFFDGPEADDWLRTGWSIIESQLPEQVLEDGGQFERSPMYHALALEDLLDLCSLAAAFGRRPPERLRAAVQPMRVWLRAMSHPDGDIGFFNDAAFVPGLTAAALDDYARRLGFPESSALDRPLHRLPASGYARIEMASATLIVDAGPIGPDHLPAHGHADTLSFELSLRGRRLLVNSGTSRYGVDAERLRQRGTAAHNTVVLDGQDSSEVWSGFRVGRRARVSGVEAGEQGTRVRFRAEHDGYRRLRGRPIHAREWLLDAGALVVNDEISGEFTEAVARFHLHPDASITTLSESGATISEPHTGDVRVAVTGGRLRREASSWHPRFGADLPAQCLAVEFLQPALRTEFRWT